MQASKNNLRLNTFGDVLFSLRRKRHMLQKQLALASGLDQSYLASLERGRRTPPGQSTIEKILAGLSATPVERDRLAQAALIGRAERLFAEHFADMPQTTTLARVLAALPNLEARELEAIETFAAGMMRHKYPGEVHM